MIDAVFGDLKVVKQASEGAWKCSCECGAVVEVRDCLLRSGRRTSCGACASNRRARGVARCARCRAEKPLAEFTPRPDRPSGLRSKCKVCEQELLTARHRADLESSRERRRAYFRGDPNGQARIEAERRRSPIKHRARVAVYHAIKTGKLEKPAGCVRCGDTYRVEAHHDDYTKPLDVMWLCTACHRVRHRELRLADIDPMRHAASEVA